MSTSMELNNEFLISKDEMLAIMSNSFHVMALRYGLHRLKNLHDENGWTLAHYVFKASQDLSSHIAINFLQNFIEHGFDLNKPAINNKGYLFSSNLNLNHEAQQKVADNLNKHFNHLNALSSNLEVIDFYYLGNPTALHLLPFFFEHIIKYTSDNIDYYDEKTKKKMKILDYAYYIYETLEIDKTQDNFGFTPFLYSLHLNCDNYANYFLNKKSRILNENLLTKINEVKLLIRDKMSALSIDLIEQLDEEEELLNIEREKTHLERSIVQPILKKDNEKPHKI
jgi:hypothetical protein